MLISLHFILSTSSSTKGHSFRSMTSLISSILVCLNTKLKNTTSFGSGAMRSGTFLSVASNVGCPGCHVAVSKVTLSGITGLSSESAVPKENHRSTFAPEEAWYVSCNHSTAKGVP